MIQPISSKEQFFYRSNPGRQLNLRRSSEIMQLLEKDNQDDILVVAIVGSRDYPHEEHIFDFVADLPPHNTVIVSGGANGADSIGERAAAAYGLTCKVLKPQWRDEHGNFRRNAGFERNHDIVRSSDIVVAFWYKFSKGTEHTIKLAIKQRKVVVIVFSSGQSVRIDPTDRIGQRDWTAWLGRIRDPESPDYIPEGGHIEANILQNIGKPKNKQVENAQLEFEMWNIPDYPPIEEISSRSLAAESIRSGRPIAFLKDEFADLSAAAPYYVKLDRTVYHSVDQAVLGAMLLTRTDRAFWRALSYQGAFGIHSLFEGWLDVKPGFTEQVRNSVLRSLNYQKFGRHDDIRDLLLDTEGMVFCESVGAGYPGDVGMDTALADVRQMFIDDVRPLIVDPVCGSITYVMGNAHVDRGIHLLPVGVNRVLNPFSVEFFHRCPDVAEFYQALADSGALHLGEPMLFAYNDGQDLAIFCPIYDHNRQVSPDVVQLILSNLENALTQSGFDEHNRLIVPNDLPMIIPDNLFGDPPYEIEFYTKYVRVLTDAHLAQFNRPIYVYFA